MMLHSTLWRSGNCFVFLEENYKAKSLFYRWKP